MQSTELVSGTKFTKPGHLLRDGRPAAASIDAVEVDTKVFARRPDSPPARPG